MILNKEAYGVDVRLVSSGMFNITLEATRGVAQVPSNNVPTLDGYKCIGIFLDNFNSAQLSTSQMPPVCIWHMATGNPYILGTPNKTYSVSIYGIFVKG